MTIEPQHEAAIVAKLRAMYLGQKVFVHTGKFLLDSAEMIFDAQKMYASGYLQLRDIGSLTDEEAITLAKLALLTPYEPIDEQVTLDEVFCTVVSRTTDVIIISVSCRCFEGDVQINTLSYQVRLFDDNEELCDTSEVAHYFTDYLREISIALPFYSHELGRSIPVAEQVENGWIKIKE